jgi:hypothetical protein
MRTELERGADRSTVLARFVSDLSDEDERMLRDLLGERAGGPRGRQGSPVPIEAPDATTDPHRTADAARSAGPPGR